MSPADRVAAESLRRRIAAVRALLKGEQYSLKIHADPDVADAFGALESLQPTAMSATADCGAFHWYSSDDIGARGYVAVLATGDGK